MIPVSTKIKVKDLVFIVVATLHKQNPSREAFSQREIRDMFLRMNLEGNLSSFSAHVSSHAVCNREDNNKCAYLFATVDDQRRLYLKGDLNLKSSGDRTLPNLVDLPNQYHELLIWAQERQETSSAPTEPSENENWFETLSRFRGSFRYTRPGLTVDEYVAELRADCDE